MNWNRLREKLLEDFYPSEQELEESRETYREISVYIEDEFGLETHFAGSASRGTCMKGDKDIDIFVLFPEDTDRNELEEKGLKVGKETFKRFDGEFSVDYAEHPYTKGEIDGHEVEIVPCYDTAPGEIKSSVDRTPHHSRWVKENLSEDERKDVVLLKRFLEANNIYGSSLKIEGFSGYLCEILVHECGSFQQLVEQAVNWKSKQVIDTENHHEKLPEKLEKKFGDEDLVVIDPVDPERNVASVLSTENYAKFVYLCWNFRNKPGRQYFEYDEQSYTEFEIKQDIEERADFLVLEFENIDKVDDIVYPQMRKTLKLLEKRLESHDFRIYESGFHVGDKTRVFFELDRQLPGLVHQDGPSVFHGEEHLGEFTSKYDNVFIEDDRLVAKTEREYSDAKKFLQDFLEEELEAKGVPGNVAAKLKDYRLVEPIREDEKWLNYLGKKLHVESNNDTE